MRITTWSMVLALGVAAGALHAQSVATPAAADATPAPATAKHCDAFCQYVLSAKGTLFDITITNSLIGSKMRLSDDSWKKDREGLGEKNTKEQALFKAAIAATGKPDLVAALKGVRAAEIAMFANASAINEASFNAALGKAQVELELAQ